MTPILVSALFSDFITKCGHILISCFLMRISCIFWHSFSSHIYLKMKHYKNTFLKCLWRPFIHVIIAMDYLLCSRYCSKHWKHTSDSDVQGPCRMHCLNTNLFLLSFLFPFMVNPCLLRFCFSPYLDIYTSLLPFLLSKFHILHLICLWLSFWMTLLGKSLIKKMPPKREMC